MLGETPFHIELFLVLIGYFLFDSGLKRRQLARKCVFFIITLLSVRVDVLRRGGQPLLEQDETFLISMVPIGDFVVYKGQLLINLRQPLISVHLDIDLHILESFLNFANTFVVSI